MKIKLLQTTVKYYFSSSPHDRDIQENHSPCDGELADYTSKLSDAP